MDENSEPSKKRKAEDIAENENESENNSATAEEPETAEPEKDDKVEDGAEKPQDTQQESDEVNEEASNENDNDGDVEMKEADEEGSKPTAEEPVLDDSKRTEESKTTEAVETATVDGVPVNAYDKLKWVVVENDGKPENMIKLVGLKSLFAKQLPKMPRAYIARLVFDKRHISLAILSDDPAVKDSDEEIIGGICFRPFQEMRFAEIAFCAVSATHQVKVS